MELEIVILYLILSCILILYLVYNYEGFVSNLNSERNPNPCTDFLSDNEFLEHMIPHHQVAVDMSDLLLPITKNPIMKHLCRKITWQQKYEISMMNGVLGKLPLVIDDEQIKVNYEKTKLKFYKPLETVANNEECNPLFFKPDEHMHHMAHMNINDKMYLEHMIPHHQVAVDMSKRLLLHTKNTHMVALCYDIIREQQYEIMQMNQMLQSWDTWQYQSDMI